jgi:radical SAM protein with 4Fe4S-binding SPASM domain
VERVGRRRGQPTTAHVTLTGGEPLVREDCLRLLRRLGAGRWSLALLCNGTLVDAPSARELAQLRLAFVQVSIEGGPDTHERIRGAGTYGQAVRGVRELARHGVPTMLSFTARADNYREFRQVAALGRQLGVVRVWADRMVPLGRGEAAQVLTRAQTKEFVGILGAERQRRGRTEIAAHRALQFAAGSGPPYRCEAGRGLVTVLSDGGICPCRRMPTVVGSVWGAGLAETYCDSAVMRCLRDRAEPARGCEGCFYSRTCGGGLRCLAAAVHGDAFVADPGCWLARERTPLDQGGL